MKKDFGRTIRDLRKNKGLSVNKFAKMVGVSHTFIQLLEKGEITTAKEDTIKRIAAILDQDPDKFLALSGKVDSELLNKILENPEIIQTLKKFSIKELKERLKEKEKDMKGKNVKKADL